MPVHRFARLLMRLLIGVVGSCLVTGIGVAALHVTTAPEIVSLLLEPASMVLLPGLLVSAAFAGARDFSSELVMNSSFGFYFGFFVVMAMWWERRGRWWRRDSR